MATTISNGESGLSVRNKLNDIWHSLDLNEIAATISDTAVDIFVYDTRKDSDGGAWRKRTQHTSWYNETLNTATRGSRKEFPAVAVIVAESDTVTIYDGDDPDLPMWMVFQGTSSNRMTPEGEATSVFALNAQVAVGCGGAGYDLNVVRFIDDTAYQYTTSTVAKLWSGNIEQRNDFIGYYDTTALPNIVDRKINDVAMTVLPNAPIDAATGLPVPTIAVATNGGVSVIKDDGTVVDITNSNASYTYSTKVSLTDDKLYITLGNSADSISWLYVFNNIPTADTTITINTQGSADAWYEDRTAFAVDGNLSGRIRHIANTNIGTPNGLNSIYENETEPSTGAIAYITSDYNTGWMNGDIKLATLSDTDATNVTGSELVTNGTFDSDLSSWTSSLAVWSSGAAAVGGSGANGYIYQNMGLVTGQTYVITFDVTATTSGSLLVIQNSNSGSTGGGIYSDNDPPVGSYSVTFTASNSTLSFVVGGGDSAIVTLDNISVRLAEEDRSVNGNGLQVFGTVTKSAVATGADLVAYSGFTVSNYLKQETNTAIQQIGTGDFAFMWWMDVKAYGNDFIFDYYDGTSTSNRAYAYVRDGGNGGVIALGEGGTLFGTTDVVNKGWTHCAFIRSGSTIYVYVNGKLENTNTATGNDLSGAMPLYLGTRYDNGNTFGGGSQLALFRISATAPSPEAIKRIYEDEKVLFQENAKAVLYGTSDAVTALAYDDSTNLLHVGTSAGRSVFQGLRRVDNTTTAVGAAISASNGLVADE